MANFPVRQLFANHHFLAYGKFPCSPTFCQPLFFGAWQISLFANFLPSPIFWRMANFPVRQLFSIPSFFGAWQISLFANFLPSPIFGAWQISLFANFLPSLIFWRM